MPYEVRFSRKAERQMARFPDRVFDRIVATARKLADDPRPGGSKKLKGRDPVWRLRIGEYRLMYTIFDKDQLVSIDYVERRTSTTY